MAEPGPGPASRSDLREDWTLEDLGLSDSQVAALEQHGLASLAAFRAAVGDPDRREEIAAVLGLDTGAVSELDRRISGTGRRKSAPNVYEPLFEPDAEHGAGFLHRRARLGRMAGAERLGASLYDIPSGTAPFPYHAHFGNEELLIVVRGRPSLRTPEGWRELDEGEVVTFPRGEQGAHQVANFAEPTARLLIVSEMNGPDVLRYPDSNKVGAREAPPGGAGPGFWENFRSDDAVEYWEGERPPEPPPPR